MAIGSVARGALRISGILMVLALIGAGGWSYAVNWRPSAETYVYQGIDVSEEDGAVQWFSVKASQAGFGYVRATMGAGGRDSRFAENWSGLYEADLRRGAMHVYSLCHLSHDQAANVVTTVPRTPDALPLAVELDFQPDCVARPERSVLLGELSAFITAVETHTGKPVLLKVSRAFERQYEVSGAIARGLWCSRDFFSPDYAARPWRMWQASRIRRIQGVDGPVHWNVVAA